MAYLEALRYLFEKVQLGSVVGCHPEQVAVIERRLGQPLPAAYREFLLWMGIDSGRFQRGSHCMFRHRDALRDGGTEILKRYQFPFFLPQDAFVFWAHQGYQFLFFRLSEGPDPPVHYFNGSEHTDDFGWNAYASFSEYLGREIVGHAQLLETITGRPNGIRQYFASDVAVHPRNYDAEFKAFRHARQQLESREPGSKPAKYSGASRDPLCIVCEAELAGLKRDFPTVVFDFKQQLTEV